MARLRQRRLRRFCVGGENAIVERGADRRDLVMAPSSESGDHIY
jgi:hypothetical protein